MADAGRPSIRTDDVIDEICARLAEGSNLVEICKDPNMPDRRTVTKWQSLDEELYSRIARARDIGQDFSVDECREIADLATPEDVNVAKLRIWHRQWEASKRASRRFGDKIQQEHTGNLGVQLLHSIPRPTREEK